LIYLNLNLSIAKVIGVIGVVVPNPVVVGHNQEIGQQLHNHKMVVRRVLLLQRKPETVIHRDVKSIVKGIGTVGVVVPNPVVVGHNQELGEQLHNHKMVVQRVRRLKHEVVIRKNIHKYMKISVEVMML
jgi:hypothetical protein